MTSGVERLYLVNRKILRGLRSTGRRVVRCKKAAVEGVIAGLLYEVSALTPLFAFPWTRGKSAMFSTTRKEGAPHAQSSRSDLALMATSVGDDRHEL